MKPKESPSNNGQGNLFRIELSLIIDARHGLVRVSNAFDWDRLNDVFGDTCCLENRRAGVSTRLMVSLHYLKYTYDFSDDDIVSRWVENPYWQYLSGMKSFEHEPPIDRSSITRWRARIGEAGADELLKETIAAGLRLKAVKPCHLKRINVDITMQEKDIQFPTDGRLYNRARQRLVAAAKERNISLRHHYNPKSKHLIAQHSRYAHDRQMKRAKGYTRKPKTYLGRVIGGIERDTAGSWTL